MIYYINRQLALNKKGTKKNISSLSQVVAGTGLEPKYFQTAPLFISLIKLFNKES